MCVRAFLRQGAPERHAADYRVGKEVRRLRSVVGMTLHALSMRVGVSTPYMSDVEHGRRHLAKLAEVATALGVTIEHFRHIAGICPTCGGSGLVGEGKPK